jgi:hypothetical protein
MELKDVSKFVAGPRNYKYTAIFYDGRRVNFGHKDYQQYKDSVPKKMGGGLYSYKNHNDEKRRKNYRSRHSGIKLKNGKPAYQVKYSPAWFSYYYLW